MAVLLSACAGLPAQAEGPETATTVPSATPEPAVVEPTSEATPIVSHGGPVVDYVSLVDALRAASASVEPADKITQEFFSPTGQIIKVNGADVQVFEYPDEAAAEAEAAQVAPDGGSIGTTMVMWMDAPHFYKTGKLIVLYVGSDTAITGLLEPVLGQQFAGR
jgi:hypothetical protein